MGGASSVGGAQAFLEERAKLMPVKSEERIMNNANGKSCKMIDRSQIIFAAS